MAFGDSDEVELLLNRYFKFGHKWKVSLNHLDKQVRQRNQVVSPALLLEQKGIFACHHKVAYKLFLFSVLYMISVWSKIVETPIHVNENHSWPGYPFLLNRIL